MRIRPPYRTKVPLAFKRKNVGFPKLKCVGFFIRHNNLNISYLGSSKYGFTCIMYFVKVPTIADEKNPFLVFLYIFVVRENYNTKKKPVAGIIMVSKCRLGVGWSQKGKDEIMKIPFPSLSISHENERRIFWFFLVGFQLLPHRA